MNQLHKVVSLDHFSLILEFENGQLRKFPKGRVRATDMWFLAFPMKLRSFLQKDGGLVWESIDQVQMWDGQDIWKQQLTLSADQLFDLSEDVSLSQLESCMLTVGMENQAPTSEDEKHHVYCVSIRPFSRHKWLIFSESIGGGHGERGGAVSLSIAELSSFKRWQEHCVSAGCDWMVPILGESRPESDIRELIDRILIAYKEHFLL